MAAPSCLHSQPIMSPNNLHGARFLNRDVAGNKWEIQSLSARDDQAVERIPIETMFLGDEDVFRLQVDRLIRRIAEKTLEKLAYRTMQVNTGSASQQSTFPDHCRRNIDDRVPVFASFEDRRGWSTQAPAPSSMVDERMCIRDDRTMLESSSHDAFSLSFCRC